MKTIYLNDFDIDKLNDGYSVQILCEGKEVLLTFNKGSKRYIKNKEN